MAASKKAGNVTEKELDSLITQALEKIGGNKENDICRYLPVPTGGYMHHFTLRKMKTESPEELGQMVQQFIMDVSEPVTVAPKKRAARGSRKRRGQITLNKTDLERMLNIARIAGDKEMIAKLTPKKSLAAIKRELIASIRQGKLEQELWNSYAEAINVQEAQLAAERGETMTSSTHANMETVGANAARATAFAFPVD